MVLLLASNQLEPNEVSAQEKCGDAQWSFIITHTHSHTCLSHLALKSIKSISVFMWAYRQQRKVSENTKNPKDQTPLWQQLLSWLMLIVEKSAAVFENGTSILNTASSPLNHSHSIDTRINKSASELTPARSHPCRKRKSTTIQMCHFKLLQLKQVSHKVSEESHSAVCRKPVIRWWVAVTQSLING